MNIFLFGEKLATNLYDKTSNFILVASQLRLRFTFKRTQSSSFPAGDRFSAHTFQAHTSPPPAPPPTQSCIHTISPHTASLLTAYQLPPSADTHTCLPKYHDLCTPSTISHAPAYTPPRPHSCLFTHIFPQAPTMNSPNWLRTHAFTPTSSPLHLHACLDTVTSQPTSLSTHPPAHTYGHLPDLDYWTPRPFPHPLNY